MKILLACEESQAVCKAFRAKGHEAYSCDIQPCSGGNPEWHIQGDVIEQLSKDWDMVIAFPPCTHLACSGAAWFEQKRKDGRQQQGIDFFMLFTNLKCKKVVIENPVGIMSKLYRKPDQKIQPYSFGDPYQKTTCLWLKGLPKLNPTHMDAPLFNMSIDKGEFYTIKTSGKRMPLWYVRAGHDAKTHKRSKTFPGIANAMADQWG